MTKCLLHGNYIGTRARGRPKGEGNDEIVEWPGRALGGIATDVKGDGKGRLVAMLGNGFAYIDRLWLMIMMCALTACQSCDL